MRSKIGIVLLVGLLLLLVGGVGFLNPPQEETIQLPPITTETLANGLKVIVIEQHQLPIVFFNVRLPAGTVHDPQDKAGLAEFTAAMLTEGTGTRTADQIADEIDFVGGQLFGTSRVDYSAAVTKVLKKDLETGLDLLADVLLHPTFPEEQMEIVRNGLLGGVRFTRDNPGALTRQHLRHSIFGSAHPLGYIESEATINAITQDDLTGFYEQYYRPNEALMVVAGDVEPGEIIARIRELFGPWRQAPIDPVDIASPPPLSGHQVRFVNKPGQTQVQIALGHRGLEASNPDYLPVQLANYVLGGGAFSSRLLQVVRSEEAKTYSVSSSFPSYSFPGYFQVTTFTRNEQLGPTLGLTFKEIEKFRDEGLTADELEGAQDYTAGSYVLRLETLSGLAFTVLNAEFYDRGLDYIRNFKKTVRSFTLDEINDLVRLYFQPENLQIVLLGDLEVLETFPGEELLPGVGIQGVEVVGWLDPVSQPGTVYPEFIAAR